MPGLDANSIPRDAIKGMPGASEVVVATGTPTVSRDLAIAITQPSSGRLVSAVYVLLPAKFMTALAGRKSAKPTKAWIVTWNGVTFRTHGADGVKPRVILDGGQTAIIDASSGEQLTVTQYSKP